MQISLGTGTSYAAINLLQRNPSRPDEADEFWMIRLVPARFNALHSIEQVPISGQYDMWKGKNTCT